MTRKATIPTTLLLTLLLMLFGACSDENSFSPEQQPTRSTDGSGVLFGISLGTNSATTRMTGADAQADETFHGLMGLTLIPFAANSGDSPVTGSSQSLTGPIDMRAVDGDNIGEIMNFADAAHTFNASQSRVFSLVSSPRTTSSFLVYAYSGNHVDGARGGYGAASPTADHKFQFGSTRAEIPATGTYNAAAIKFIPDSIYRESGIPAAAADIISYLNGILNTTYSATTTVYGSRKRNSRDEFQTTNISRAVELRWGTNTATQFSNGSGNPYYYRYQVPPALKTARDNFISNLTNAPCTTTNVKDALDKLLTAININYNDSNTGLDAPTEYTQEDNYKNSARLNYRIYNNLITAIRNNITSSTYGVTTSGTTANVTGATFYNYPSNLNLPDGISLIGWNGSQFELVTGSSVTSSGTTLVPMNQLVYPAQLWYYDNTLIQTTSERFDSEEAFIAAKYQGKSTWDAVLAGFSDGGTVTSQTEGVALVKKLNYGVARLKLRIRTTNAALAGSKYLLTGVFVGNQHVVGYNFLPTTAVPHMVYDKVTSGISLEQYTDTLWSDTWNHTLLLPSDAEADVPIVLEFQNNSDSAINAKYGEDNVSIPTGGKFYLMGKLEYARGTQPTTGETMDRIFASDHETQVGITITSLDDALPVLPDTSSPLLVFTLNIDLQWQQATTTSVGFE